MHERCEMYKAKAVKAILDITGNSFDADITVMSKCYLYQCGEDELSYHIRLSDGYNLEDRMKISILELYLEGNEELAKMKYKES